EKFIGALWKETFTSAPAEPFHLRTLMRSGRSLDTNTLAELGTNILNGNALINLVGREKSVEWVNYVARNFEISGDDPPQFRIRDSGTVLSGPFSADPPASFVTLV